MKTHLILVISYLCASLPAHAVGISGQGTWETTLQARDLDGVLTTAEAYYDTALNITWLADANYAYTSGYQMTYMTWADANAWAASLNPYGSGITGWRLPTTNPIDGTTADDGLVSYIGTEDRGFNISAPGTLYVGSTASELAHLFYNTLGNKAWCDPTTSTVSSCSVSQGYQGLDWGLTNAGPFSNIQSNYYWSATEYVPAPFYNAWYFNFGHGNQNHNFLKSSTFYAWAVRTGDVGAAAVVPIPAAAWQFGSGLLGLIGVSRKKAAR